MRIEDVQIILNLLIRYKLTKSMLAPGFYQKQKKSEPQAVGQVAEVSEANMYIIVDVAIEPRVPRVVIRA